MTTSATPSLTWCDGKIFRDGALHRILSGAVHYFRVHPDQWEDRLRRLAAMGANTVDTYVAWNFHERAEGEFDFSGWRDIVRFIRIAGEVGLDVFLRPSPYICAEWSNGGLPFWLSGRTRALRSSNPVFLAAVDAWYDVLIPQLAPLQAAHGGPIRLIQVENEYGSYGSDAAYLRHLHDGLRARGMVELLTTADGTTPDMVDHGDVTGAMRTMTFGTGVSAAEELRRDGEHLMCSELWGGWFDHWGEKHHVRSVASMMGTVDELLAAGGSLSLYMAHGGTNFGLWNGANHDGVLQPTVTSYDSNAPIGEDGTLNEKFSALRAAFEPFHDGELPAIPDAPRRQPAASAPLQPAASVLQAVRSVTVSAKSPVPLTFEELGAEDGLVAYQAEVSFPESTSVSILGLRDRATVFLDDARLGTLEHDGTHEFDLPAEGGSGMLTILVESLGRINYGPLVGEAKGILRGVVVGGRRYVHGWAHRVLGDRVPAVESLGSVDSDAAGLGLASFEITDAADAWLAFPGGAKGMVWLNGFLLGRYWERGPQETLYAPAPLWRDGVNEIAVLDTDRRGDRVEIREGPSFGEVEEFIGS